MIALLRKFWHYLALLVGVGMIVFEVSRPGGLRGESWFWLVVGVLIVILAGIEISQRLGAKGDKPPGSGGHPGD